MWMDPPATTSAPDATEPSTVTSPDGKFTNWPERTEVSNSKDADLRRPEDGGFDAVAEVVSLPGFLSPPAGQSPRRTGGNLSLSVAGSTPVSPMIGCCALPVGP